MFFKWIKRTFFVEGYFGYPFNLDAVAEVLGESFKEINKEVDVLPKKNAKKKLKSRGCA